MINKFLRDENASCRPPKFNDDIGECLRFDYKGFCNSACDRSDAHKPVKQGSSCLKKLIEYKEKASKFYKENKRSGDPDFD